MLLREGKNLGEAEKQLREIVEIDPRHKRARQMLDVVRQKLAGANTD
jgi:hypothetical protein